MPLPAHDPGPARRSTGLLGDGLARARLDAQNFAGKAEQTDENMGQTIPPMLLSMTRKDAQIELGAGIRHFRRRRKLTMECLCEQAGVSRTTLHHLERGDRPARAHTVTAILSVLDLAPDDLRMVLGYLPDDVRERTLVVLRALPDRRPQDASCAEALYDYDVHLVSSGMVPMGELVPVLRSKGIDVRWEEDSSITFRLPGRQLVDVTTWLRALEARFVWDDVPAADPSPVRHNY